MSIIKDEYVIDRFKKNGLWEAMQDPEQSLELEVAEELIMSELTEFGLLEKSVPSAGI